MARRSSSRKVARAAATGGGRTSRGQAPVVWYSTLALVVVLGVASVAFSRHERQAGAVAIPPTTSDHWRAAYAFDLCGTVQPNLAAPRKSTGITTKGDGLIHIDPKSSSETGANATLGRFVADYPGMLLSGSSVRYPSKSTLYNGHKCGSTPGVVQVKVWSSSADTKGRTLSGDPASLLLENGQLITIAFVPKGASIPRPPSRVALANPTSSSTGSTPTTTPTTSPTSSSTTTHP
jgi:hypothetical protein